MEFFITSLFEKQCIVISDSKDIYIFKHRNCHYCSKLCLINQAYQNRGARRRCLQFEDAQHNIISNRRAQDPLNGERATLRSLETPSMPDGKLYPTNTLNSSIKLPKPSGIGLHLNSILNTVQAGSGAIINLKAAQWGEFSVLGDKIYYTHNLSDCLNDSSYYVCQIMFQQQLMETSMKLMPVHQMVQL